MLSRVAESVHWTARYVERAEDITRALAVQALALLDAPRGDVERGLAGLVTFLGDPAGFAADFGRLQVGAVTEYFITHAANPSSVVASIGRARENARAVREQISSEMWEHLNRLYFAVKDVKSDDVARGPYEFYRTVRDGSQAFQGITHATMTHNEAYWFLQLGKHVERTSQTLRVLGMRYATLSTLADGTSGATLELIAMLKACSAFEPFRQTSGAQLTTASVAEFLLVQRHFPRAVLFCLNSCAEALERIADLAGAKGGRPDRPRQLLGRLCADLQYLDIEDVLGPGMPRFLDSLLTQVHRLGDEIARSYFTTRSLPAAGTRPHGAPQEQQQQEQQQ